MSGFENLPLPLLLAIFALSSGAVWWAGVRLSHHASVIADRTGLGQAIVGIVLLGFATSLPEVATTVTASAAGNAPMAVNNLLGGVAFQVVVLAIADIATGKGALTALVPSPRMMLYAVISLVLLIIVAFGVIVGDVAVPYLSVGIFPVLVAAAYIGGLWLMRDSRSARGWRPTGKVWDKGEDADTSDSSNLQLALATAGLAATILIAGFVITRSAEAMAAQTGVSNAIVGLTLIAAATSLPEVSTTIAAVRMRKSELAIGDVLGGNMFDVTLILLVDVVYAGGLALQSVDRSSLAAALIGMLLTCLVLFGMIERRDKTLLLMGYDSIGILLVYLLGIGAIVAGVAT